MALHILIYITYNHKMERPTVNQQPTNHQVTQELLTYDACFLRCWKLNHPEMILQEKLYITSVLNRPGLTEGLAELLRNMLTFLDYMYLIITTYNPSISCDYLTINIIISRWFRRVLPSTNSTTTPLVTTCPTRTDPVTTRPTRTDPVTTPPVRTHPTRTDPVTTPPATTHPVTTHPVITQSVLNHLEPNLTYPVAYPTPICKDISINAGSAASLISALNKQVPVVENEVKDNAIKDNAGSALSLISALNKQVDIVETESTELAKQLTVHRTDKSTKQCNNNTTRKNCAKRTTRKYKSNKSNESNELDDSTESDEYDKYTLPPPKERRVINQSGNKDYMNDVPDLGQIPRNSPQIVPTQNIMARLIALKYIFEDPNTRLTLKKGNVLMLESPKDGEQYHYNKILHGNNIKNYQSSIYRECLIYSL